MKEVDLKSTLMTRVDGEAYDGRSFTLLASSGRAAGGIRAWLERSGWRFSGATEIPADQAALEMRGRCVILIYDDPWDGEGLPEERSAGWHRWAVSARVLLEIAAWDPTRRLLVSVRGFLRQPREFTERVAQRFLVEMDRPDASFWAALDGGYGLPIGREPAWRQWRMEGEPLLGDVLRRLEAVADLPSEPVGGGDPQSVTVVIPCYNDGCFLREALFSVQRALGVLPPIIVADDGSTDPATCVLLEELAKEVRVLRLRHGGLSHARNEAIRAAQTPYILPLDADNLIEPAYIGRAVSVLDRHTEVGMVYANARYFGGKSAFYRVPEFSISHFLCANTIDACAVFRKCAWERAGGYDEQMPDQLGWEDWEFWIRLLRDGWRFHGLDEFLFYYRARPDSMVVRCNQPENFKRLMRYMTSKHRVFYERYLTEVIEELLMVVRGDRRLGPA